MTILMKKSKKLKAKDRKFALSVLVIAINSAFMSFSLAAQEEAISLEGTQAQVDRTQIESTKTENSQAEQSQKKSSKINLVERIQIVGHDDKLRTEAGSATLINEVALEKFKFDDINRVLYNVPGVNIREEDGYGLRPNIGFRGATPERSKKITVMEDGILIGPAPYSAPAAYYFPMMSKMTSLEVSKGPAAIKYGPNTTAGALNMTTREVSYDQIGMIDIMAGANDYSKVHGFYSNSINDVGILIEGINMRSDGFKTLDGGGTPFYGAQYDGIADTGFDKNDVMAKFQYELTTGQVDHTFELKVAYADEHSNETYLGLTDEDLYQSPDRRYVASELDNMDWRHQQAQFTHLMQAGDFDITTRVYRNNFERSWFKINGFKGGPDLQDILANPHDEDQDGTNARYYQLLTGQVDSVGEDEKLVLGDNAREYYSQGIQTEIYFDQTLFTLKNKFNIGVRFHQDQIERNHTTDNFVMSEGHLVSDASEQVNSTTNREKTDAISVFFKDTLNYKALDVTFGLRGEFIDSTYQNRAPGEEDDWQKKSSHIWLPSISAFYTINENLGLLFGVHEGFTPTSPKEGPEVDIENSVNYEFGARFYQEDLQAEAVFFFNDMSNLKESCSFSAASSCGDSLDKEFNGGEADVFGLEFSTSYVASLTSELTAPISLVYTYSDSEFKNSFESDFPMWGNITAGDSLPYLAEHQLTFNFGLAANSWDINFIVRYIGEMLEASGDDVTLSGVTTEAYTVIDFSANYLLGEYGKVYLKADNLLDKIEVVSRRPYGARPSKSQQVFIGYQYNF